MFGKLLVANRGEIACRIIRTARRMGIATVAVYSEADAEALHVAMADEAWPIGPSPARESYLVGARIVEVARRAGAEAVHPGYGFLSENAEFAEACAAAGLVFVGPPAEAIRAMGSKAAAKALMAAAGVPLVPGYHGEAQAPARLAAEAARIGYPVLIKASAGGGGKGMRVVEAPEAFASALAGAQGEAVASFGDSRVLIERYLAQPRHVEIQVFADTHGNVVSLFERDCSVQRRHQKVIEEAPAPGLSPERRASMGEAAIAAARAVGYVGAGTVEFIAEGEAFHFMEMNTRLQVEHPVTEMITGQDLVEWQLRVADGERLPKLQHELGIAGHAIEARLYAEDPGRDFLPSIGRIAHLRLPAGIRVDTGVREGDAISPHYDPMIAKLIAHGADRAAALARMRRALEACEIVGIATNLGLLRRIAAQPDFAAGRFDTGFIARHAEVLQADDAAADARVWLAAALAVLASRAAPDPLDPWSASDSWRMNGSFPQTVALRLGEIERTVAAESRPDGMFALSLAGETALARLLPGEDGDRLRVDGVEHRLRVLARGEAISVLLDGRTHVLHALDKLAPPARASAAGDRVLAPIPGRIARFLVAAGDVVSKGAPLVVLEAMKMELTLAAPIDGVIAPLRHAVNDMVEEGVELVGFETPEPQPARASPASPP